MSRPKRSNIVEEILSKISELKGDVFEDLVQAILSEAGFQDVVKQTAGSQDGFDIRANYQGQEWRFEAKKTKVEALDEKEMAVKFDQIERNPGDAEYFILVTNANLSNNLRNSVEHHRSKWIIDIDYWSLCNTKFHNLLLSYPNAVIKQLSLPSIDSGNLLTESQEYLTKHKPFLLDETENLLKTSNRLTLLQKTALTISKRQIQNVRPETPLDKIVTRKAAFQEFEKYRRDINYPCFFLIAKEQMGKSSLMQLWASSIKEPNVVFFFIADSFCRGNWLDDLRLRLCAKIERISSSKQCPEYLSTIFYRLQPRLKANKAHVYMFIDALNSAPYEDVKAFFMSEHFRISISEWRMNWIFSCRETTWNEWRKNIAIPNGSLEYALKEFDDEEFEGAVKTHQVNIEKLPFWLRQKLKHPGMLRLCSISQSAKPDAFYEMPEMTLAEISLMFIKERLDEFSNLFPGGEPISFDGVQKVVNEIVALFSEQRYGALPFETIKEKNDFNPYKLSSNSWNILLQQGFLTKNQESYEMGNDWATILIGKYLIDTCLRFDIKEPQTGALLDQIFDGIAPLTVENRVSIEASNKFIDILWFSLHYGKIKGISENLFRIIMERVFAGQNLAHEQLSEIAARLFPVYSARYLANVGSDFHGIDLYLRAGLEKAPAEDVIPEIIKYFPHASEAIQLQMAILLEHYKDVRFLEQIYLMIDRLKVKERAILDINVEHKIDGIFGVFPDECNQLVARLFETGKINSLDYAIGILGWNGGTEHIELLRKMIKQQPILSLTSLRAMGRLRLPEVEVKAMQILSQGAEDEMQNVSVEALGNIQSSQFLQWCKAQKNIWNRNYYWSVTRALQSYTSSDAYDYMISCDLIQDKWIPFFFFYDQNRHRRITEDQTGKFIEGIVHRIHNSTDENVIWRGFHNLASLNLKGHKAIWQKYQGTNIPSEISGLARFCARPEHFASRGQTLAASALETALRILDWIEDKEIIMPLLRELMYANIPRLFAWTLYPYVTKYTHESYKAILIQLATYKKLANSTEKDIYELVQNRAMICLTHLNGSDVAKIILEYRTGWISDNDRKYWGSLKHFKTDALVDELVDIIKKKNSKLFWSAYCFLWEFLPAEIVDPAFIWMKDEACEKWILGYLLRLLGKFDRPEYNKGILEYLNNSELQNYVLDVVVKSKDSQIHEWFKQKIIGYSLSSIVIVKETDKDIHAFIIKWINLHVFKESKPYIEKWLESKDDLWFTAQWLLADVYELIEKLEFWDLLGLAKKKYYLTNPGWSSYIVEPTLKLFFRKEPDWAWAEFLKYWDDSSNSYRKDTIQWVKYMPSKVSMEWLLDIYIQTGNFFSDEKEIRTSIVKMIFTFPHDIKLYGIELLKIKAASIKISDRIFAASCCGLFGGNVYRQFGNLMDDGCERVRHIYQYSVIADEETIPDL